MKKLDIVIEVNGYIVAELRDVYLKKDFASYYAQVRNNNKVGFVEFYKEDILRIERYNHSNTLFVSVDSCR